MQAIAGAETRQVDVLLVDDDKTGLMILTRSLERANLVWLPLKVRTEPWNS